MSFSRSVRKELAKVPVDKRCCAAAELAGAALASGGMSFRGAGKYGLCVSVDSVDSATRFQSMIRRFFGVDCFMTQMETSRLGGVTRFQVQVPDESSTALARELSLIDESMPFGMRTSPMPEIFPDEHCKKAFLRGAYIVAGAAGDPEKGYHLEIDVLDRDMAESLVGAFSSFGISSRVFERKQRNVVYIKDGEQMSQALAVLGAYKAMMEFENTRIIRDCRNEANRLVNCDSANVDKAIAAAERQISMIEAITRAGGMDELPEPLRELASARVRFPYASMSELGAALNPPLGKSGVNARMRKLQAIAEDIVND